METPVLLGIAAAGIALLLVLIIKFKVQAFVALLLVSLLVGLAAGIPLTTVAATEDTPERLGIIQAIVAGMGGTLGTVAILVALGAMLGRLIEVSGVPSTLGAVVSLNGCDVAPPITGVDFWNPAQPARQREYKLQRAREKPLEVCSNYVNVIIVLYELS